MLSSIIHGNVAWFYSDLVPRSNSAPMETFSCARRSNSPKRTRMSFAAALTLTSKLDGSGNARTCALLVRFFFYQRKIFLDFFFLYFSIVFPR